MTRNGAGDIASAQQAARDIPCSPVFINARANPVRTPITPAVARGLDFERRFDHLTLFYDIFREDNAESTLALGPHVPAHLDPEKDIQFFDAASGAPVKAEYLPSRGHIHGDMYRLQTSATTSTVVVRLGCQGSYTTIQPNLSSLFAGLRVLTNRARNDPIAWIVDWAWYHVREFGFNAILHYDNGSSEYSAEDVAYALRKIPGLDAVVVLPWPFPMEPPLAVVPATGQLFWHQLKDRWAESARLEHQRRRFLMRAELVLVADTDELLLQRNPERSIDALFPTSETAWVRFMSELIVNTTDAPDRLLRHRDLYWVRREPRFKTPKYLVRPNRCPDESRWWLHDIAWAQGVDVAEDDFVVAHFIALTTGWGEKANRSQKQTPLPGVHYEDLLLRGKLSRVFDERAGWNPHWATPPDTGAHRLRAAAYEAWRDGQMEIALRLVTEATAQDPYHPMQYRLREKLRGHPEMDEPG